jgi:hypothetical protein
MGAITATEAAELARVRSRRARSLAVLLDVPTWAGESPAADRSGAELLRESGWGVVVVGQQADMATVWSDLCRVGATRARAAQGGAW